MNNCKKCNIEFTPIKGLINYCSLNCRNSRDWSIEDKKKKSESLQKKYSLEEIEVIKEKYKEIGTISGVALLLNVSRLTVRYYVDLTGKQKQKRKTNSENVSEWRKNIKKKAVEYKGGKCQECGYDKCIRALKFHHLNPNEKDFNISGQRNIRKWDKIKEELDKCILVCGNCHDEIHEKLDNLK